jgi:hypothetical protein
MPIIDYQHQPFPFPTRNPQYTIFETSTMIIAQLQLQLDKTKADRNTQTSSPITIYEIQQSDDFSLEVIKNNSSFYSIRISYTRKLLVLKQQKHQPHPAPQATKTKSQTIQPLSNPPSLPRKQHQTRVKRNRQHKVTNNNSRKRINSKELIDSPELRNEKRKRNHTNGSGNAEQEGKAKLLDHSGYLFEEGSVLGFFGSSTPIHVDADEMRDKSLGDVEG